MLRANTQLVTILFFLHLAFSHHPRVLATEGYSGKPLVIPITRDESTNLYMIPFKDDGRRLVLDLAGPLVWSTCDSSHDTFRLHDRECLDANQHTPPRCWAPQQEAGHGQASSYNNLFSPGNGRCAAHPYNPFSGECAAGDLTRARLAMNDTNGMNPLRPVSFPVVASCAPATLLGSSLPAGAVGVAGLSSSALALPAQVAATQRIPNKFALCLPGAAIFGGGPFFLMSRWGWHDMAPTPVVTPLQMMSTGFFSGSGRYHYYIKAKGLAVNTERLPLFGGHELSIALSPRDRYTALRPDVYRELLRAFAKASSDKPRVTPPVAPFGLCYDTSKMISTRLGYDDMPRVDLMLDGGWNWTMLDGSSLVGIDDQTACLAFVEMGQADDTGGGPRPAIAIGGFQMEDNLLLFDLEKMQLGISMLEDFTGCGNFNFTVGV